MRVFLLLVVLVRVAAADPMNAVIGDAGVPASAANDVERIRGHLAFVLHELRARTPAVAEPARARRVRALDELEHYIARGEFPRRTADRYGERRPRFIDDRGVHCAVAYLIATGSPELARAINATHEYDYILDIDEPALIAWAEANGFSLVELAMIQPTYHEWPADEEVKIALDRVADDLVLRCGARSDAVNHVALRVEANRRGVAVDARSDDPFEECFASEASKLRIYAEQHMTFDVELSLHSPQQILDARLASLELGCMPRPGELPETVTVSVEPGVLVVVTTPVNTDVARCLFERNESRLRPLLSFAVRGEVTKKIPRFTPQMFDYAFSRAKDRVIHDCQKAYGDGVSISFGAGAKLDGDVWVDVPGSTKVAACMREKLPAEIRKQLSVPLESGETYFRIDADVPRRPQYMKCGNGVCY